MIMTGFTPLLPMTTASATGGGGGGGTASTPATSCTAAAAATADPHFWLEDVLGKKALDWVEERNAACFSAVGDPKTTPTYDRILSVLDSKDKIPSAYLIGNHGYYNFWQDENHVQGIWRRTSLESFKSESPEWTTVLDLDALPSPLASGIEDTTAETWVWHGSTLLDEGPSNGGIDDRTWDRALIKLSPGGSDADTCREFDLTTSTWVPDDESPFVMSTPAKTQISYRSRNEVLVGTDFGGDGSTLTDSGYPRVVKSWKRGTSIDDAQTVFECQQTDIAANVYAYHDRGFVHEFQMRSITFYTGEYFHRSLTSDALRDTTADAEETPFRRIPIPLDANIGTFADSALVTLRSDMESPKGAPKGTTYKAGSMIALPFAELMEDDWTNAKALFEPTPSKSLSSSTETRDYLVLKVLEDVRTGLVFWKYDRDAKSWTLQEKQGGDGGAVAVGEDVSVASHARDNEADNVMWLWRDGYLVPDTLEIANAEDGCATSQRIKSKPDSFDAKGMTVEQNFATSADGTKIPYFVIRRSDLIMDGSNPTLLDAYGGFEISMLPGYSGGVGVGWLERGGVKVIANIRGGGEYGPKWHQAARKSNRRKCYEDVEAVATSLIDSGLTSPPKLACIGGSNGGLMVGNLITRPLASRLFGAAVCQVPLLDMKRYSKLLAGASWMDEYGDPDKAEEWKFLRTFSPYQMLRHDILGLPEEKSDDDETTAATPSRTDNWKCPKTLFTTSTRDDRVHPGHARKMVAALIDEAGTERAPTVHYWENTEGGHGGAADNKQRAAMWALTYNFLAQQLGL